MGGHLRREIVDHDGKLLRESWRLLKRSWFDASKDLVHSGQHVRGCRGTGEVVSLLRSKGSETLLDVFDGCLGEFRVNGGESIVADFLVIGASKMPRKLDGGLLRDWLSCWLDILHLDILKRDGEGFEAEAKGLGG